MANVVLTGRFFDENNQLITGSVVRYFGIHRTTSGVITVSNTRVAEGEYYSFNFGDPDWLGQDRPFLTGETWVVVAWQEQSEPVNSTSLVRFSVHIGTHTGQDVYIIDQQLKPKQTPPCSYNQVPINGTVGDTIVLTPNSNPTVKWTFNGFEFQQIANYFTVNLFNIATSAYTYEYSFNDGTSWQTSNTFQTIAAGTYTTRIRYTDNWGNSFECGGKSSTMLFSGPVACLNYTPTNPYVGELITVTSCALDPGSVLTSIDYYFDDTLVATNTDLLYTYSGTIDTFKSSFKLKQVIHWFDGENMRESVKEYTVYMANRLPIIEHIGTEDNDVQTKDKYTYTPTFSDLDGTVESIRWILKYKLPFSGQYADVLNTGNGPLDPIEFEFPQCGTYSITSIAVDNLGGEGSYTSELDIPCIGDCPECPEPEPCPELPPCPECPPQEVKYVYITDNVIQVEFEEHTPEVTMEEPKEIEFELIEVPVELELDVDLGVIEINFNDTEITTTFCQTNITITECTQ